MLYFFLPFSSTKVLGTNTGHYYGWKHLSRRSFFSSLHQIRSYLPTARVVQHDVEFRHLNFCKVLVFFFVSCRLFVLAVGRFRNGTIIRARP